MTKQLSLRNTSRFLIFPLIALLITFSPACKGKKEIQQEPITIAGFNPADIFFKVQLGAFVNELSESDPFFANLDPETKIQMERGSDGLYRYTVGYFDRYSTADAYEIMMKEKGFTEAFVTAYGPDNKTLPITMTEVVELLDKAGMRY